MLWGIYVGTGEGPGDVVPAPRDTAALASRHV